MRYRSATTIVISTGLVAALAVLPSAQAFSQSTHRVPATSIPAFTESYQFGGPFTPGFNPLLSTLDTPTDLLYEPLMWQNAGSSTEEPLLATSYTWTAGGETLAIQVRKGVYWSDGKSFTASDVAFTFNLLRQNPALNSEGLSLSGSATAPSSTVAIVHFSTPGYQLLPLILSVTPVPEHIWDQIKDPVTFLDTNPVGDGPYILKTFTPEAITFTASTTFWAGEPRVPVVEELALTSQESAEASFLAGDLDDVGGANTAYTTMMSKSYAGSYITEYSPVTLWINYTVYPLNLLAVREAISMSLGREAMAKAGSPVFVGDTSPTGLTPPNSEAQYIASAYRNLRYGTPDPGKARQLLEEAGFKMGSGGIFVSPKGTRLEFQLIEGSSQTDLGSAIEVMAEQLKKAGIGITLTYETLTQVLSAVRLGDFVMVVEGATVAGSAAGDDPYLLYRSYMDSGMSAPVGTASSLDEERFPSSDASSILARMAKVPVGTSAALADLAGLEKIQIDDVPVVPLFNNTENTVYSTKDFVGWPGKDSTPPDEVMIPDLRPVAS